MATPRNKLRNKKKEHKPWPNEVVGILLSGAGILLMLSLISYSPHDLPNLPGIGGSIEKSASGRINWIGPVGAFLGYVLLMGFGAAAYLIPLSMLWIGVAKLVLDARPSWRTYIGCSIFVLSGSALLGVQNWFLIDWAGSNYLEGPGGLVGYGLGTRLLEALLNKPGAILVLLCIYLVSLILLTGLHPIQFTRGLFKHAMHWWQLRKEKKREKAEKRSALDQLRKKRDNDLATGKTGKAGASGKQSTSGRRSKATKNLSNDPDASDQEDADPQPELPLKEIPEPQIIDASQRRKPSADPATKPFAKKKPEHSALSTDEFGDYELPGFDLLDIHEHDDEPEVEADKGELVATQKVIVDTLKAFGVEVTAGNITRGPTITRYEVYPSPGLRVSRITQLEADIARATKAERINILAPVPGSDTVGIEIANNEKVAVPLHELLQDPAFTSAKKKIPLALGKDVYGNTVIGDLAAMPHLLVAGATGSGKSVCINSIISSILFKFSPNELRFIMVDPKVVEMQMYNSLPHLAVPVVTDPNKVIAALRWVVNEMERRYR
ncbi:MAG: DNA translocase FtsK 4TM domain-containing protein, partial [Verrucomicrobiae bacterium]|nr:DNA translocase FtsK 4TM domain-containing protein [Verrucomicrobiae bacterium]NNJ85641.1 DNA translocase FtsK [Akkermansiaceae bacterium]